MLLCMPLRWFLGMLLGMLLIIPLLWLLGFPLVRLLGVPFSKIARMGDGRGIVFLW